MSRLSYQSWSYQSWYVCWFTGSTNSARALFLYANPICHNFLSTLLELNEIIALNHHSSGIYTAPLIPPSSLPISGRSKRVLIHSTDCNMASIITPFAKCSISVDFPLSHFTQKYDKDPSTRVKIHPPPRRICIEWGVREAIWWVVGTQGSSRMVPTNMVILHMVVRCEETKGDGRR